MNSENTSRHSKIGQYILDSSTEFDTAVAKLKRHDLPLVTRLDKQVAKILRDPTIGKPLRNVLKNCRRVHIGSFVLVYEVAVGVIRLLDFDHHDRIYKRLN